MGCRYFFSPTYNKILCGFRMGLIRLSLGQSPMGLGNFMSLRHVSIDPIMQRELFMEPMETLNL